MNKSNLISQRSKDNTSSVDSERPTAFCASIFHLERRPEFGAFFRCAPDHQVNEGAGNGVSTRVLP